jgi:CRP-like cAMP-binding protein
VDAADALYMMGEGRVRLTTGGQTISEVGPGESFGTWALIDDSERGQRAECIEEGLALALHRDEFYDVAAGDLTLLQEVVRALARRLRAMVARHPEDARVEGEGIEKPEAMQAAEAAAAAQEPGAKTADPPSLGADLAAAALGQTPPRVAPPDTPKLAPTPSEDTTPEPTVVTPSTTT